MIFFSDSGLKNSAKKALNYFCRTSSAYCYVKEILAPTRWSMYNFLASSLFKRHLLKPGKVQIFLVWIAYFLVVQIRIVLGQFGFILLMLSKLSFLLTSMANGSSQLLSILFFLLFDALAELAKLLVFFLLDYTYSSNSPLLMRRWADKSLMLNCNVSTDSINLLVC